jgi:hypothetical protein
VQFLRILALLLFGMGHPARAGEVIVHAGLRLDFSDVRDVYLGEKQLAGDIKLLPSDNLAAQDDFLAAILQTTERNYQARWRRKAFRDGLRAPTLKGSDAEVMGYVRSTPGAIGYLAGKAGPGVIVVGSF